MKRSVVWGLAAVLVASAIGTGVGCASWVREGLDPKTMPPEVQPDYALFALRCSKCHSLARPLTSGIDDDAYWVDYVARMRRQPASGISQEDTVGILRFLHYFSIEEKRKSGKLPSPTVVIAVPQGAAPPPPPIESPQTTLPQSAAPGSQVPAATLSARGSDGARL